MLDELSPPNRGDVKWNPNEKIIGIVGVAPHATVDFYQKLLSLMPVQKDWEYIRVIIDFNTKIPSRGRCLELNETNPSTYIRQNLTKLHQYGARVLAVPCNTAHYFFDEFTEGLDFEVVNMIEATSEKIINSKKISKQVGILASAITTNQKLYDRFLKPQQIEVLSKPDDQATINQLIANVKRGVQSEKDYQVILSLISSLHQMGAEGVIIGCTELSALLPSNLGTTQIYDSNEILAKKCYELAK